MQPYRFVEKKFSSCVFRNLDGSLPSAMISDVILIFPPNLRGLKVERSERSLMWTVETTEGSDDLIFVAFRASIKKGNQTGYVQQNSQFG